MPKFGDINELNFTTEQLNYFETEMRKYRVPWLYKLVFGNLYQHGAALIPVAFFVILITALIHALSKLNLWPILKVEAFAFIFGIGGLVFISWVWQRLKVLNECKRLGLTLYEWNTLAVAFQITYI